MAKKLNVPEEPTSLFLRILTKSISRKPASIFEFNRSVLLGFSNRLFSYE